jgi:pyruvate/2-oxoglutarate dehydrogenase complex dihydrolipoamide dehydrogenase (E3) component
VPIVAKYLSANEAIVIIKDGITGSTSIDAILVGIGRGINTHSLQLAKAGITVKDCKVFTNDALHTTNKMLLYVVTW